MDKHHDHYRWFTNRECEYYPCHEFAEINCLFCFCPLYFNDGCGGEYTILKSGIKGLQRLYDSAYRRRV